MSCLRFALPLVLAIAFVAQSGCVLYFGDDDDDCVSADDGAAPVQQLRNPETGQCETVSPPYDDGDPYHCDPPVAEPAGATGSGPEQGAEETDPALSYLARDWASCYSGCEELAEEACLMTPACRAVYVEGRGQRVYAGCWGTAPSGPIAGGGCAGLDAYACSLHDDCSAVHAAVEACGANGACPNAVGGFLRCEGETAPPKGCYSTAGCPQGQVCNASEVCLPPPGCDPASGGCPDVCYGWCVTPPPPPACEELASETQCVARVDCVPIYKGIDCACTDAGCTCQVYQFERCTTAPASM